jgi:hypothetical protein
MKSFWNIFFVVLLTGLSGVLDARGFLYAGRAWPDGVLDWRYGVSAVLAFVGGLSCYVVSVRFMQGMGVTAIAVQTGIWFLVTAIGVALMDGTVGHWTRPQQVVGILVTLGMFYLAVSTAQARI